MSAYSILGNVIEVPEMTVEVIEKCIHLAEEKNAIKEIDGVKHYALMFPDDIAHLYTYTQAISLASQ